MPMTATGFKLCGREKADVPEPVSPLTLGPPQRWFRKSRGNHG